MKQSPWLISKYIPFDQLEKSALSLKKAGKSLVTLNGSFDLLHAGHLSIIYEASLQGDHLIVALNSDDSVRHYKSPSRPIIPLEYRLSMMAAVQFVSYVTAFDQTTPLQLLEAIKPDVHVNGAEYGESCIEANLIKKQGGRVHIVPLVPGLSTSAIIEKIIGILPAHAASGAFFTATSMIGMIALAGIIVRNSILLVDFVELGLERGHSLTEAVVASGLIRARPIILTALAVVIGGMVMVSDPIFQGLGIALISGAVVATALTLVAIPLLYYEMHK